MKLMAEYILILPLLAALSSADAQIPLSHARGTSAKRVTTDQKQRAYSKMMEGQVVEEHAPTSFGHIVDARMAMIEAQRANLVSLKPPSAVELIPICRRIYRLELVSAPPNDVDEAINLSSLATKIDPTTSPIEFWLAFIPTRAG
jgi:hypothetical protein